MLNIWCTFCVYMFILCCVCGTVIWTGINCVFIHDKHPFYVGSVGWYDIHWKLCQLSRECMLPRKPLVWLYTSDTGALQYSILHGSVKSSSLKRYLSMCVSCLYLDVYKIYPSTNLESVYWFKIVLPSQVIFPHLYELCDCWTWSVHSEQCSAYGVVHLLCDGYIKAENDAWAGQIW